LPGVEHRQSCSRNNRCENAHRPTRQRAYRMHGLQSAGHAQRFLSVYGPMAHHFCPRCHLIVGVGVPPREEATRRALGRDDVHGTGRLRDRRGKVDYGGMRNPLHARKGACRSLSTYGGARLCSTRPSCVHRRGHPHLLHLGPQGVKDQGPLLLQRIVCVGVPLEQG
jgi:hypothetical protein